METRANMPTKILSLFLSVLMAFSCFSIALPNLAPEASAVSGYAPLLKDGAYSKDEVKQLLATAASEYNANSLKQNSGNLMVYSGKYSMLYAADAIVSYAFTNLVTSFGGRVSNNTGETLAPALVSNLGITDSTQQSLIYAILDPAGTDLYSYYGSLPTGSTDSSLYAWHDGSKVATSFDKNKECTNESFVKWEGDNLENCVSSVQKNVSIELSPEALTAYLLSFDSAEDLPNKFPTKLSFTYKYGRERYAYCTSNTASIVKYVAYYWNYYRGVNARISGKNTQGAKAIQRFVNYFDNETLSLTFDQMLDMSAADLHNLYLEAEVKNDAAKAQFNNTIINHFEQNDAGYTYQQVLDYMENLLDAYNIALVRESIDVLITKIPDTDYSDWSYAQMLALHAELTSAKAVFDTLQSNAEYKEALQYLLANSPEFSSKYASVSAMNAGINAYIQELYDTMRLQRLRETLQTIEDTYDANWQYVKDEEAINTLDDIDTNQVAAILDKANALNGILTGSYNFTSAEISAMLKEINADVAEGDEEITIAKWNTFIANLEDKLASANILEFNIADTVTFEFKKLWK